MEEWKQAFQLVRFELNYWKLYLLLHIVILLVLLYLVVPIIPEYFEESSFFGLDFLFLCILTVFSQLAIPKAFKPQSLGSGFWASHFVILLNQLAVRKETIVKYRLLMYSLITASFTGLFLVLLYLLSPYMQQNVPISTYIVFSLFWFCFSIYVGCIQPVFETGSNVVLNIIITFLLVGPVLLITVIYLFYIIYSGGFVQWTIMISTKWPLLTVVLSLLLAAISFNFWMKRMKKRMENIDYFS